MNLTETAKPGQNLKPVRKPASSGGRLLSVVHGKDERSLHLSPILQQIKDDGPALIEGVAVKEGVAPKLAKPAGTADAKAAPAAAAAPQQTFNDRYAKALLGLCTALAIGLCASLYFSWQQQQRLAHVEYLLEALVTR